MFEIVGLNYIAIVFATFINVGLGAWWYSPAGFGKLWSKLSGVDMMKTPKEETQKAIGAVFVGAIIQVIVLAVLIKSLGVNEISEGLLVGFILWLGFIAATSIGDDLYSRRGWKFWWLNASFFLAVMLINSVVFSVW